MKSDWRRGAAMGIAVAMVMGSLSGCSTASKDISPTYVSPLQYQSYDCTQLAMESKRIQSRVVELGGRLDTAAKNDAQIMGVGLILFWPVLFALGGTKQQEAEYGRLRGEYDAISQSAVQKKCGVATDSAPTQGSSPVSAPVVAPAASASV